MRCIDFPEANAHFVKPNSMTDEECYSISAFVATSEDGRKYINTVWQPNKEDIEAIVAGRPIVLQISGGALPPIGLFTYDENGVSNNE